MAGWSTMGDYRRDGRTVSAGPDAGEEVADSSTRAATHRFIFPFRACVELAVQQRSGSGVKATARECSCVKVEAIVEVLKDRI